MKLSGSAYVDKGWLTMRIKCSKLAGLAQHADEKLKLEYLVHRGSKTNYSVWQTHIFNLASATFAQVIELPCK